MDLLGKARRLESRIAGTFDQAVKGLARTMPREPLEIVHAILDADAARLLAGYMRDVVLSGTGRSLHNHPGRIAGKTGTAEVDGRASHSWFVGFAPFGAATRRIAFAVVIENAGYGAGSAAPAAGEIVSAAAAAGLMK